MFSSISGDRLLPRTWATAPQRAPLEWNNIRSVITTLKRSTWWTFTLGVSNTCSRWMMCLCLTLFRMFTSRSSNFTAELPALTKEETECRWGCHFYFPQHGRCYVIPFSAVLNSVFLKWYNAIYSIIRSSYASSFPCPISSCISFGLNQSLVLFP